MTKPTGNNGNGVTPIRSTELRTRTREVLERVRWYHAAFVIETYGAPAAVLLNVEIYENLKDQLKSHGRTIKTISLGSTELRVRARAVIEQVRRHHVTFMIETYGEPTAVLLDTEEYQKLTQGAAPIHTAASPRLAF